MHSKATVVPFQIPMFLKPICTNQFSFIIHLFFALVCLFCSTENLQPLSPLRCVNVFFFILQFMACRGLPQKESCFVYGLNFGKPNFQEKAMGDFPKLLILSFLRPPPPSCHQMSASGNPSPLKSADALRGWSLIHYILKGSW